MIYNTWDEFKDSLLDYFKSNIRKDPESDNYYLAYTVLGSYARGDPTSKALKRILHDYNNKAKIIEAYERFELLDKLKSS